MSIFDDEKVLSSSKRRAPKASVTAEGSVLGGAAPNRPLGRSQVLALQRSAGNAAVAEMLAGEDHDTESPVKDVVGRGGGNPLPSELRDTMESRFGEDFSSVRIHSGPEAQHSAQAVNAKAYTVGDEIVFGSDSPALDSSSGQRTLAHELTHVVQQRSGPVDGTDAPGGIKVSDPSDRFEVEAEQVADEVTSRSDTKAETGAGHDAASAHAHAAPSVQRDEDEEADDETEDEVEHTEEDVESEVEEDESEMDESGA